MQPESRPSVFGRSALIAGGLLATGVVLYVLRGVLTPIFLAFTIAYMLDPVVDRLQRWKLPRAAAIAVVMTGFFSAIALFLLLVVPDIVRDVIGVAKELPRHAKHWLEQAEPLLARAGVEVPHSAEGWLAQAQAHADTLSKVPLKPFGDLLGLVVGGTFSAIGAVLAALIVPILAVYFLHDFDDIIDGVRDLVPLRHRAQVSAIAGEVDEVLGQFMRGQLTVMAILAVLYGGAYYALGIRLAIPIGLAAGVLNIVPYVGSAFALLAGLLMAAIGGGSALQIGGVVVAYVVVQTLEGFVITPRIVGNSVGLREVWVLLALFIGGEVFGFLGVLLAVPAAAVLKIFFSRAVASYQESSLYREEGLVVASDGPPLALRPEPPVPKPMRSPPAAVGTPREADSHVETPPAEPLPTTPKPVAAKPATKVVRPAVPPPRPSGAGKPKRRRRK